MAITSQIDQLLELKKLYEKGILTKEELDSEKQKILSSNQEAIGSCINDSHSFERVENDLFLPNNEIVDDRIKVLQQYFYGGALSYEELIEETTKIKQESPKTGNDLAKLVNTNTNINKMSQLPDKQKKIIKSLLFPVFPIVISISFIIGLFVFHENYVYTDFWIEEGVIIGIATTVLVTILLAYYLMTKKYNRK